RALDMALDEERIAGTLGNPRHVKSAVAGRELWTRGKVAAVLEPRDGFWAVITFMWSTADGWARDRELLGSRPTGLDAERTRKQRYAMKMTRRGRAVRGLRMTVSRRHGSGVRAGG